MVTINVTRFGMAALFTVVLAGCSSTGSETENPIDQGNALTQSSTPSAAPSAPRPSAEELEAQRMLAVRVFYFDFDKSDLKPEAREALVHHANQLRANPAMRVRLEGHADERGTREYNLALGERRAQAVERYLQVQGVSASQIEIVSFGEERPAESGTTEAAYSRNRRVEVVY